MLFGNDEGDHPLSGACVSDNEVAEASGVIADVVEGQLVCNGVVADGEAYLVAECVLKGAVLNIEDFVE